MAKEFIIRDWPNWMEVVNIAQPVIGKKAFRVVLYRGLKRTVDQNSLMHAVFEDCAKKTGKRDAKWWKNELKNKLGKKSVHFDLDDQPTIIVHSTTEYSTKEMADFCEKIVAYMKQEYQADIELPEEIKKQSTNSRR